MTDVLSSEQRHRCMSHVRSKNTKPEIMVRKFLFSRGFRFRVNVAKLPGTPDIVLRKYRTVIFVNGCFWHGHENCRYFHLPQTNTDYWKHKIETNQERDLRKRLQLRTMGWHVIQLWECQLKPKFKEEAFKGLLAALNKIVLLNYKAKPYGMQEQENLYLNAAEEEGEYGND